MVVRTPCWALATMAVLAACSGSTASPSTPKSSDAGTRVTPPVCADAAPEGTTANEFFPCDVDAVLEHKCRRCHNAPDVVAKCVAAGTCANAPFPLLKWGDTRRDLGGARPIDFLYDAVESGSMPCSFCKDVSPPVEPLTAAEKRTILDWALACAPPGSAACSDGGP